MRKFFYSLFTVATMLLAVTSCSQEEDFAKSSQQTTTFSISLDDAVASRAYSGDGTKINILHYEVFYGNNSVLKDYVEGYPHGKNVELPLLTGETYGIVFWAQNKNCGIYDTDNLSNIKVDYSQTLYANQESYDAFCWANPSFKADGNNNKVVLKRPFAQLNLGSSDWEDVMKTINNEVPVTQTSVKVTGLANVLCPLEGKAKVSGGKNTIEATFGYSDIPDGTFTVKGEKYQYLSCNYLLVPNEDSKANVDVEFGLKRNDKELKTVVVPNVPMKPNYRTNIIGNVLTGTTFDIEINDEMQDPQDLDVAIIYGIDGLKSAMDANTSENPVAYHVNGLSSSGTVEVVIPSTFMASEVTFVFKDIKDQATLKIMNADGGDYSGKVNVKIPNQADGEALTSTTITLDAATVELFEGNWGAVTGATAPNTIIIGKGAVVSTLTVVKGNVEVYGKVTSIAAGDSNDGIIIVTMGEAVTIPTITANNVIVRADNDVQNTAGYVAQFGEHYYTTLASAIMMVEESGEIKMVNNHTLSEAVVIPAGKNITLDLNDKTISKTEACTAHYSMIENKGSLTITGEGKISFTDSGEGDSTFGWGSYTIANYGTLAVKSGTIEHLGKQNTESEVKHMYCAIQQGKGTTTVEGGKISNPTYRSIRINAGALEIKGGVMEGQVWLQPNQGNVTIHVEGGEFSPRGADGSSIFMTNNGENYTVTEASFTGGKFNTKIGCSDATRLAGVIKGGTFTTAAKENTNPALLADGCAFESNGDGNWVVNAVFVKVTENAYEISSLAGLEMFRDAVNAENTFEGCTITLKEDIDLQNAQWKPIGYWQTFNGTFDGGNHTISNLKHHGTEADCYIGLFGCTENATIKNLTIKNADIKLIGDDSWAGGQIGALVGYPNGNTVIEDITLTGTVKIEGAIDKLGAQRIGAVIGGYSDKSLKMTNITVDVEESSYVKGYMYIGGVAGAPLCKTTMNNVTSNIDVYSQSGIVGGIIGYAGSGSEFTNCSSSGDVTRMVTASDATANQYMRIGGIIGAWEGSNGKVTLSGCQYTGKLSCNDGNGNQITEFENSGLAGRDYHETNATGLKGILEIDGETVAYAGYEKVADGVWKQVEGVDYKVSNAEGLAYMNQIFADESAGRDVVLNLVANIDFTKKTWTPVDSHADKKFEIAEINGNGFTISNFTIKGQAMFTRFAGSGDVVIKNITFDNANVDSEDNINTSILTGHTYQNLLLDNVDVKNSTISGGYKVAPFIGTVYNESETTVTATLKNCDVENVTVKATSYDFCTAGMVAFVYEGDKDKVQFEKCTVKNVKLMANPNGYTLHAAIYVNDADTNSCFDAVEGVTVENVTFEKLP